MEGLQRDTKPTNAISPGWLKSQLLHYHIQDGQNEQLKRLKDIFCSGITQPQSNTAVWHSLTLLHNASIDTNSPPCVLNTDTDLSQQHNVSNTEQRLQDQNGPQLNYPYARSSHSRKYWNKLILKQLRY